MVKLLQEMYLILTELVGEGCAVDRGTATLDARIWVRFPVGSLEILKSPILSVLTQCSWGTLSLQQMSTKRFPLG
jgi:hypothetical protein